MKNKFAYVSRIGLLAAFAVSAPYALSAQDEGADEEATEVVEEAIDFSDRDALAEALGIPADDPRLPELDDEVVVALNKSLHSWQTNKHTYGVADPTGENGDEPSAGSDLLDRIIEEELDPDQIRLVVKAEFERAKFNGFADRFDEKAETATSEKQAAKFAENADRMRSKGDDQYNKFDSRVDSAADEVADEAAEESVAEAAEEAAASTASESAKLAAREKAAEKAAEKARGNAAEKAREKAKEKAREKANEKAKEKARGHN
jgi:hypothetical protein